MKNYINEKPYKQNNLLFVSLSNKNTLDNSIHNDILTFLKNKFNKIYVFCYGEKFQKKEGNIHYLSGNIPEFFKYLKKIKMVSHIYINDFFVGGAFGVLAKNKKKAKLIFRCGSPWRYELNSLSNILKSIITTFTKAYVIKNCDKIVYNSKAIVQKKYRHNYEVVYNGVDTKIFKPTKINKLKKRNEKLQLLYIGRVKKDKGLDYLFTASKKLKHQMNLGIVGKGDMLNYYKEKYPWAKFYGKIKRSSLPTIINEYNLVVLPALYNSAESFPNVLIESMACGKPIIGTNVHGIPEIITSGVNGYLFPEKNSRAIMETLLKFLQNPSLLQLGKKGRTLALKHFEKEQQIQKLYKALFCQN